MNLKIILLDPTILDEGYTMGGLWLMRENLYQIKENLEKSLSSNLGLDPIPKAEKIKKELNHVDFNIDIVEMVMTNKETLIFQSLDLMVADEDFEIISLN
jgi:hypothetical protein